MSGKSNTEKKTFYSKAELSVLKDVNRRLALLVDYRHQFKSGVLRGIGFAIGASIIGAIVVTIILSFFQNIDIPFVQEVINNAESTTNTKPAQNE